MISLHPSALKIQCHQIKRFISAFVIKILNIVRNIEVVMEENVSKVLSSQS